MPRILLQQGTNLVNKFALLLHSRFAQDSRDKPENDGSLRCWLSICYKLFKYPSPADKSATSPARGEVLNNITLKDLNVVRQYAALFERRVQSSTRVRKAQAVTRQTNPIGRSMIEMLGVLAIVGVLSVGGIAGYSKAMMKFKTNQIVDQVSTIVTNIKTLYAQQKNYNGLDNDTAISIGAVPNELGTSTDLTNSFGGSVFIITNSDDTFEIYFDSLPKEACITLATNDWGNSSGLIAIQATSTEYWVLNEFSKGCEGDAANSLALACPGGSVVSVPMPPQIAAQACNCTGNTCTVGWKYY